MAGAGEGGEEGVRRWYRIVLRILRQREVDMVRLRFGSHFGSMPLRNTDLACDVRSTAGYGTVVVCYALTRCVLCSS